MLDLILVGVILIIVLAVGIAKSRHDKSLKDYALANKSLSKWVIFATLSASFIGGGFSIGVAEKTTLLGIGFIVAMFGFSFKELLVAKFIAPYMGAFSEAITIGDIVQTRLGTFGKIVAGILGCVVCGGVVGAQVVAIGNICFYFFNIPLPICILLGAGVVILYSSIGGIRAIITTDIFQFSILAIGIPILFLAATARLVFDSTLSFSSLNSDLFLIPNEQLPLFALVSLFLTFLLGETLVPPYVQRLLIGKSTEETEKGTRMSGYFSFFFFAIAGVLGLIAQAINPDVLPSQTMFFLADTLMPIGAKSLLIAGLVSAVMSTADSFLHAAAVSFTHDIAKPISERMEKPLSEKAEYVATQIGTVLIGILAILSALYYKNIIDLCIISWTYWSPVMLVPLIMIIRGKSYTMADFLWGSGAAIAAILIFQSTFIDALVLGVFVHGLVVFTRRALLKTQA